jgi:hypothetical protein
MAMTTKHMLSLVTLVAAATALPTIAAADHPASGRTKIGDVGTHRHDAEDYIRVSTRQRFDRLELRAHGRAVPIDRVRIQFADGSMRYASVRSYVRPGQGLVIDVPAHRAPIKMLILDYGNTGPFWRAREDARVEVFGLSGRYERSRWYGDRGHRGAYDVDRRDHRAPAYWGSEAGRYDRDPRDGARRPWRGGGR